MISMVDTDGDGQVSFEEFHRLIIDPDPSRADFGNTPIKSEAKDAAAVTQARRVREMTSFLHDCVVAEETVVITCPG